MRQFFIGLTVGVSLVMSALVVGTVGNEPEPVAAPVTTTSLDCPTEDSCRAEYGNGAYRIVFASSRPEWQPVPSAVRAQFRADGTPLRGACKMRLGDTTVIRCIWHGKATTYSS